MINKTFSKILSLGIAIVLTTSVITVCIFHTYYEKQAQSNLKSIAEIVSSELNTNGDYSFINDGIDDNTRLTLIAPDGTVLADNTQSDVSKMESHANRPEFKETLKSGTGSTIRKSSTIGETTFYYAIKLNNGDVLRVAVTSQSVFVFYNSLIIIAAVMLVVLIISLALSYAITKSIVNPITELGKNLDDIENVKTYEELQPFVETVKEQRKKQKLLDKQKKQFTANVSHELKTPLTSIAGYAELIENGMAKPEDVKPFAHTIRKQALRLVSLTEDIIQLSQLDEIEDDLSIEEVDMGKIAEKCVDALEMNAKAKGIEINLKEEHAVVNGNASLLEELVYNLIDNAVRYNKENGTIDVSVTAGDHITVSVSDTGIGIPEKYQSRIFERFFRVDKSRSKETGGTGLGLAIVKHIAEVHNATISVHSVENVGTTIMVEF